jgi:protein-tyrosine-phosphatase
MLVSAILLAAKMSTIVFVCEHGAAKSVVAAAHFNKLAAEKNLPYRAIARGTEPQPDVALSAANGLRAEGLEPPIAHPLKLTKADIDHATRVITFCELPKELPVDRAKSERWDAPATGDGYEKARDVIVAKVRALIAGLDQKQ